MDAKHCAGCHNDFYNGRQNFDGKECWSLKTATLVKKIRIHIDQPPPYKQKPETVPSCYHVQRYVMVKPENLTDKGFWK